LDIVIGPEAVRFSENRWLASVFNRHARNAVCCLNGVNVCERILVLLCIKWLVKIIARVASLMPEGAAHYGIGVRK
jgi:hypothetical protein